MTRGIRNNNPDAIDNKTAMAETATANSAGGLCLSSPHHSTAASGTPRGLRNNNPLNIRCSSSQWKGKVDPCTMHNAQCTMKRDPEFEQFISMYYGFRAAFLTIETYIIKHGCNTIRTIINRWAPKSDGNNTENYIRYVCNATGIGGNEPLSNHDRRLKDIVWAMAKMESGQGIEEYRSSLEHAFDDFTPKTVYQEERKKHHNY